MDWDSDLPMFLSWFSGHLDADHPICLEVSCCLSRRKCPPCKGRFCNISSFKHRDLRANWWFTHFVWIRELKCRGILLYDVLSRFGKSWHFMSMKTGKSAVCIELLQFAKHCHEYNFWTLKSRVRTILSECKCAHEAPNFKKLKGLFT